MTLVRLKNITLDAPVPLPAYTQATVPPANLHTGALVYITDFSGGAPAYSNGVDWIIMSRIIGGATVGRPTDRSNQEVTTLVVGEIVSQHGMTAKGLIRADSAADNAASRVVGVVTQNGGIPPSSTGEIATVDGDTADVLLVAGLTPALGDLIVLSTTAGKGTIAGSGVGEPTALGSVSQSIGIVIDTASYGTDSTVLAQLLLSQRRVN